MSSTISKCFWRGFRDGLPFLLVVGPFSVLFGVVAAEAGLPSGGHLPLEVLAMAQPEAVITGRPYPGASRSEEVLDHPAVQALRNTSVGAVLTDRDWICGTPHVLRAIDDMRNTRRRMEAE